MKFKIQKFFIPISLLIVLFTSGCQVANRIVKEVEKTQAPQTIIGTDNRAQLTVPGNWQKRTDLHDEAEIQAANLFKEQYVIVMSESKIDFSDDLTLKDFTDLIIGSTKKTINDVVITEVKTVKVNGYDANQFEITGTVDKVKARWLYTLIEAPNNFHQIVTWSLQSKFEQNRETFMEVINSFKELESDKNTILSEPVISKTPSKKLNSQK